MFCIGSSWIYEYLRDSGYPLPLYRTLCRKLQQLEINFGIFKELKTRLLSKTQDVDKFCILSIDEMHISDSTSVNKHKMEFVGNITLGSSAEKNVPSVLEGEPNMIEDTGKKGQQLFVALLRGAMNPWKQVIGCHITGNETSGSDIKRFVLECIDFAAELGLSVIAISSDMGGKNRNLWKELQISLNKDGSRINKFDHNGNLIYVIADQCHLLKNLKSTLLNGFIKIPEYLKLEENLPNDSSDGR